MTKKEEREKKSVEEPRFQPGHHLSRTGDAVATLVFSRKGKTSSFFQPFPLVYSDERVKSSYFA